jgi:hypothetical protein
MSLERDTKNYYFIIQGAIKPMTLSDYLYKNIPDYYKTMYLDGYTPE